MKGGGSTCLAADECAKGLLVSNAAPTSFCMVKLKTSKSRDKKRGRKIQFAVGDWDFFFSFLSFTSKSRILSVLLVLPLLLLLRLPFFPP